MHWNAKPIKYKGIQRIGVYFEKNQEYISRIKKITDARWSQSNKVWHIPDTIENRKRFNLAQEIADNSKHHEYIIDFIRWMKSKRYSENTIKTYSEALRVFLTYYHNKLIDEINNQDIINFNNDYILKRELSASYQNQIVNGIKLFFQTIKNTQLKIDIIHRPKRAKTLPNVLSKEEVKEILQAPQNIKHKAMLSLIYCCGLRCGELIQIKPEHIDSKRNILIIKQSKGKKDRIVPLGNKIIEILRNYYQIYRPLNYLFEGQIVGNSYDERSLQLVLKQAVKKAKINKPVTLHWLRHSYATHLLESGTNLRYIQEILGHSSSKTTEIYTHVSTQNIQNIKSPFETL